MTLAVLLGPNSTVGDSRVQVDSPIAFEKEAYHLPYVLTVLRAVLLVVGRSGCVLHPFRALSFVFGPFKGQIGWMYARFSCMCMSFCCGFTLLTTTRSWCTQNIKVRASFQQNFGTPFQPTDLRMRTRSTSCEGCVVCGIKCLTPPQYEAPSMYGPNMVGLEGAEWKRHRAIAKTAFNEANAFAWQETIRIVYRSRFHSITRKDWLPQTSISVATWYEKLCYLLHQHPSRQI